MTEPCEPPKPPRVAELIDNSDAQSIVSETSEAFFTPMNLSENVSETSTLVGSFTFDIRHHFR